MNYDFDNEIISEQLTVPILRKPRMLAWMRVFTMPAQYLWEKFTDFKDGSLEASFNPFAIYSRGSRCTYTDNRTYEFIYDNPSFIAGLPPDGFPQYWQLVNDNFVGSNDRVKFNSQIIMIEWQLNIWFRNPLPANQIYIGNNSNAPNFWLGASGATSSKLAQLSQYSSVFLANINTLAQFDFTVYVPIALFTTLGTNTTNRENNVRRFVDKYKLAGILYNVVTY